MYITLWLFNIAMENTPHLQMIFQLKPPFIVDFSIGMLNKPMVLSTSQNVIHVINLYVDLIVM